MTQGVTSDQQLRQLHVAGSAANTPAVTSSESPGQEKSHEQPGLDEHDHTDQQCPTPFNQSAHVLQLRQQMPHEFDHRSAIPTLHSYYSYGSNSSIYNRIQVAHPA